MQTQAYKLTPEGYIDYDFYLAAAHQARAEATRELAHQFGRWVKRLVTSLLEPGNKTQNIEFMLAKHCH